MESVKLACVWKCTSTGENGNDIWGNINHPHNTSHIHPKDIKFTTFTGELDIYFTWSH
jgi:hypothetical protein